MKKATTIEEQINIFKSRGMIFQDEEKAKEILLDIGYYRLGSYSFPFEKTFPKRNNRTHEYVLGTSFQDVVDLYYFDGDLRQILAKALNRIEVNFRTFLTYTVSNHYLEQPTWFITPGIVSSSYISKFEKTIYNSKSIKDNPIIKKHHQKYLNDKFAPAWKTIEYMTFGNIIVLYRQLKNSQWRRAVALHYGCTGENNFKNYLNTIKVIRNTCAHGGCLYDIYLTKAIAMGAPIKTLINKDIRNINGAIEVIKYILGKISINRMTDLTKEIYGLVNVKRSSRVAQIVADCSRIDKKVILQTMSKTSKKQLKFVV